MSEDAQSATTLCHLVGHHPARCVVARDEGIAHRHFTDPQQRHPTVDFSLGSSSVVAMGTVLALFISTRFSGLRHEAPDCCQRGGDSLPFGGSSILRRQPIGCLLCASELTTICSQFYSCLRLFPSHSRRTLHPLQTVIVFGTASYVRLFEACREDQGITPITLFCLRQIRTRQMEDTRRQPGGVRFRLRGAVWRNCSALNTSLASEEASVVQRCPSNPGV